MDFTTELAEENRIRKQLGLPPLAFISEAERAIVEAQDVGVLGAHERPLAEEILREHGLKAFRFFCKYRREQITEENRNRKLLGLMPLGPLGH